MAPYTKEEGNGMPRPSKPWWRASHSCFYAKISGRLIRLDPDEQKARRMHSVLIAGAGEIAPNQSTSFAKPLVSVSVANLVQLYLEDVTPRVSPRTLDSLRYSLDRFQGAYGAKFASEVRGHHLLSWGGQQNWGDSSKRTYLGHVRMMFRWAVDLGHLDAYHLARLRLPAMQRTATLTEEQVKIFESAIRLPCIHDFWTVGLACGARPGELRGLSACHIAQDHRNGVVTGKTGERTIWFARSTQSILDRLCKAHPDGPILRGTQSQPWRKHALEECFRRISRRIGFAVSPKASRKVFASRLIARGVNPAIVAKLLGHASYATTMKHYVGFEQTTLIAAIDCLG